MLEQIKVKNKNYKRISKNNAIGILKALQRNNFDINLTSKLLGIDKEAIDYFIARYGSEVFNTDADVKEIAKKYDEALVEADKEFISRVTSLRDRVVEAIDKNLDKCTNINHLAELLKTLNDVVKSSRGLNNGNSINLTFMQKIDNLNNVIQDRGLNKKLKEIIQSDDEDKWTDITEEQV